MNWEKGQAQLYAARICDFEKTATVKKKSVPAILA